MKLARTIRLDVSDANVFPLAAEPGEWAVTGTFAFADADPAAWDNKQKIAFRDGWLGTESFGRASFVQVTTLTAANLEATTRRLAAHLFEAYGAPGMIDAMDAARHEIADMAALCDHPVGTLLAIERQVDDQAITERTRVVTPPSEEFHTRIWSIEDEDEEAPQVPDGDDGEAVRLQRYLKALQDAWAEFEHQARRYGDARERATLGADEVAAERLRRNMADNAAEQARVRAEIARLKGEA